MCRRTHAITLLIMLAGGAFAVSSKDLPQLLSHPEDFNPAQQDDPYGDEIFNYKQYSWGEDLTVFVNQSDPNDRSLWIQTSNVDKVAPKRKLIAIINDPDATYEVYKIF